MTDREFELMVKRSRHFALLCALILLVVTTLCLMSYIGFGEDAGSSTCDVKDTQPDFFCGNAGIDGGNDLGAKLFKQNCAVCHSAYTSQKLTGAGLLGMQERLPKPTEEWFTAWVLNSEKVLKSGDGYAKKIYKENGKADMTVFEGQLSKEEVHELYLYLTGP